MKTKEQVKTRIELLTKQSTELKPHGKNVKLADPLLHFGYSDKENKFSMYTFDADRLIHFERWILIQ